MGIVYAIRNTENGDEYIGSSYVFEKRRQIHINCLKRGKHHARKLQCAFDKFGIDAFEFLVLEDVQDDIFLRAREQFWLWRKSPAYNTVLSASIPEVIKGTKLPYAWRAKIAARNAERWNDPDYRQRMAAVSLRPEVSERRAEIMRRRWEDDDGALRATFASQEFRSRIGAASRRAWADETLRAEQSARVSAQMQKPGVRETLSEQGKAQWADPEKRRYMLEKKRSSEVLKKQADLTKAHWADPEITARRVAAMNTPEAKKKKSDALKAAWARRKASNVSV